ncbi:hypothetical protein OZ830_003745 [Yersinia enterocolitica]
MDRILKSSNNQYIILNKAFSDLSNDNLRTFAIIMATRHPFNIASKEGVIIDHHVLKDSIAYIPKFLDNASNKQVYYYIEGILRRNLGNIKEFCRLEQEYLKALLFEKSDCAQEKLSEIQDKFGESYWSVTQRITLSAIFKDGKNQLNGKKYNDTTDIFLKVHQNQVDDISSGSIIKEEDFNVDKSKFDLFNLINYRLYGFNSTNNSFDIYRVLRFEALSTIVDLFKAFELLCYQILSGHSNNEDIPYDEVSNFINEIQHYVLSNHSNRSKIKKPSLDIYDNYTDGKYLEVINKLENESELNISHLKLLAKSLSHTGKRLIEKNLYNKQANLLAEIYSKNERFSSSLVYLYNLTLSLRGFLFFTMINHRIIVEKKGYLSCNEKYINKAELIFSPDNTPFKLNIFMNKNDVMINNIEFQESSTFKLFNRKTEDIISKNKSSIRYRKYLASDFIEQKKYDDAVNSIILDDDMIDCELSRVYIQSLSLSGQIEKAAQYFLSMYKNHPQAIDYFITEEFYEELQTKSKNSQSIDIGTSLYLCRDSYVDKKMNINATGISIGKSIKSMKLKNPSEISFQDNDWKIILFLSEVCSKEILTKTLLYRTQDDAYNERIKICNVLANRKIGNYDKLINESKVLSKRKVLEVAEKQINSTKIYADKDYILNNIWDDLTVYYNEYIKYKNSSLEDIDIAIENMVAKSQRNITVTALTPDLQIISQQMLQYVQLGRDYRLKSLFQMIKLYIEEFCFGVKGLNSYLSTRIRHGTLSSTITSQLVSNGFYPSDEGDEEKIFLQILKNLDDNVISEIKNIRIKFRDELNRIIDMIINSWVQITANKKGNSESKFNFDFNEFDLLLIQKNIGIYPTFDECCVSLDELVENKLISSCELISESLDIQIRSELSTIFDTFESRLDLLKEQYSFDVPFELNRIITTSKQHVFNQLDLIIGWFKINQESYEEHYDFDIIIGIIENMVQLDNIKLIENIKIKVSNHILSPMVDLMYNLVNNAIIHSGLGLSSIKVNVQINGSHEGNVVIKVNNNTSTINNHVELNKHLAKYEANMTSEELKKAIQTEGNSGIARVRSTIRHELNSREKLTLGYISDSEFSTSISFSNGHGVTIDENLNCRG